MEMVRVLVGRGVGKIEFIVYTIIFLLLNIWGYFSLVTDSPPEFTFAGGAIANILLLVVSELVYFVVPAILAWKKMTLKEYVKYLICIDMPFLVLLVLAFVLIPIVFILGAITLVILGVISLSPAATPPTGQMSLLMFLIFAVVVMTFSLAKPYLMKKLIDARKESSEPVKTE